MVVTPTPSTTVTSVQVAKIGGYSAELVGSAKAQQFKLLNTKSRRVRIGTYSAYITVLLRLNKSWKMLWQNRRFDSDEDVMLLQRHIDEASLDSLFTDTVSSLESPLESPLESSMLREISDV